MDENTQLEEMWQDREIRFDIPVEWISTFPGEILIDKLEAIEDVKGNSGEKGHFLITNLRFVWHSTNSPRINLTVGLNCISAMHSRTTNSRLIQGSTEALHVVCSFEKSTFEFIFANIVKGVSRLFTSAISVHKAYDSSRMYRELKLRVAIISEGRLKMLPLERLINTINGVWNLSSDQGALGTFFVTNVRVVWAAQMNELFNVSVPYIQIKDVRITESKFGKAFVIESGESSGNFVLGFKIDPIEKLSQTAQEIKSVWQSAITAPIFGVEVSTDVPGSSEKDSEPIQPIQDDVEIDVTEKTDVIAAYLADSGKHKDRPPVYSEELGVAIEQLPEGVSLKDLWQIVPD